MNIGDQVIIVRHAKTNAYKRGEIVSKSTSHGTDIYGVLFADLDETYFYADYEVMPRQVVAADTRDAYVHINKLTTGLKTAYGVGNTYPEDVTIIHRDPWVVNLWFNQDGQHKALVSVFIGVTPA